MSYLNPLWSSTNNSNAQAQKSSKLSQEAAGLTPPPRLNRLDSSASTTNSNSSDSNYLKCNLAQEANPIPHQHSRSQIQHHAACKWISKPPCRLEEDNAIALLRENGWNAKEWKVNCNLEERNGALYWAATNGHVAIVRRLVRNGTSGMPKAAGKDLREEWRNSALGSSAAANHVAIIQILLEQATEENLRS
ncbi:hypothetical protein VE01_00242 [Pseudogymnoascus verrucosus]|uniref:Uncharacterized protein n=1 Tax=Pseudogymnoascus verrucosus TaxID=342668 RepID=A0A2P2SXS4_9PEZI|nr:uncharacterized protein VE01_00242 [Pseudogymnoascus verrucosus]OBU01659.1 hypothetical protein VE01_00242 [Pseudogymnoascus verrucosus]